MTRASGRSPKQDASSVRSNSNSTTAANTGSSAAAHDSPASSSLGLWASQKAWCTQFAQGWDRFWFTPTDPATLCMIRVLAGAMLVYTHAVWTLGLDRFLSPDGMLSPQFIQHFKGSAWAWSHLYWIPDGAPLMIAHAIALVILVAFWVGWQTPITGLLSAAITISYANRAPAALFGLDQINGFLALYLAVGPSGACLSVDRWLAIRRQGDAARVITPSTGANVSIRLMQLHMCVVYLFAGLGKFHGESWWTGEAFWGAVANKEYQTLDLTWLAYYPFLVHALTHITVFWETFYPALVWPKLTRPIIIALAFPLHLGIAFGMGMITFGTVMIIANLSFLSPQLVRRLLSRFALT